METETQQQEQYARTQAWEILKKYGDSEAVMLAILENLILSTVQHDPRYKWTELKEGN